MVAQPQRSEMPRISIVNGVPGYVIDGRFVPRMAGGETPPGPGEGDPPKPAAGAGETGADGKPFDAARAQATIDTLRAEVKAGKAASTELAAAQARLKAIEDAGRTESERQAAELAELKTKHASLETQYQTALIQTAIEREAVKLNAVDPDVVFALVDRSAVTLADGAVTGADTAVAALLKAKPYLVKSEGPGTRSVPATGKPGSSAGKAEQIEQTKKELRSSGLVPF
jgi:hypothetical protein